MYIYIAAAPATILAFASARTPACASPPASPVSSLSRPRKVREHGCYAYRGTPLIRNCPPSGPYKRTMPRTLWWP